MAHLRKYIAVPVALALLLLAYLLGRAIFTGSGTPKLSVVFVGLTNGATGQMTPTRIILCQGATGLCAMFMVSNITTDQDLWFETVCVEEKTETGWQQFPTKGNSWGGVGGGTWTPGYGCFEAVGWPPGLPTNATWRLQVRYGREPSVLGILLNNKLKLNILKERLRAGKAEGVVLSPEVKR